MSWKIIGYGVILILAIALGVGVYMKMTQATEGQKAKGNIINYTFEPHQTFFGCARYNAPGQAPAPAPTTLKVVK